MNEQMSSNSMAVYIPQLWGKFTRKYLRKHKVKLKLATGNFSYLLLKPQLVGYPVVLAEQACVARLGSLRHCYVVPLKTIQTKP